jgi:hypothetical protein
MLAAHTLAYRLVTPDGRHRHDLLETTGHSWSSLIPLLLGTAVLCGLIGSWSRSTQQRRGVSFLEILTAQVGIYTLVETFERVASGSSIWPGNQLVLAGAAIQLPVTLVIWLLLRYVVDPVVDALRGEAVALVIEHHSSLGFPYLQLDFATLPSRTTAGRAPPFVD